MISVKTQVKRGVQIIYGNKELVEKLNRNGTAIPKVNHQYSVETKNAGRWLFSTGYGELLIAQLTSPPIALTGDWGLVPRDSIYFHQVQIRQSADLDLPIRIPNIHHFLTFYFPDDSNLNPH